MATTEQLIIQDSQRKETVCVSAIIPCYRCAGTIEHAVASVAAQTWRPAELVLVDDASGDDTLARLHSLQNRYGDWIRVVSLPANGGPGVARNAGWEVARQPYVAFLDSDDAWHPRKIEIQLQYMDSRPQLAITGHGFSWQCRHCESMPALPERYAARLVSRWHLLMSNCWATRTVMLRRDLSFRFEAGRRYSEDYQLWLRLLFSGHLGAHLSLELAYCYKAPYGAGGLSSQMWAMEKGELANYRHLYHDGLISLPAFVLASAVSVAKYVRRLFLRRRLRAR